MITIFQQVYYQAEAEEFMKYGLDTMTESVIRYFSSIPSLAKLLSITYQSPELLTDWLNILSTGTIEHTGT